VNSNGYVVGWGTLSLLNAGLAQAKGRSGLAWWLLSLLLGPLATFLLVVMPFRRVEPAPAPAPIDTSWQGKPLTRPNEQ
jgi:hypothetical protein